MRALFCPRPPPSNRAQVRPLPRHCIWAQMDAKPESPSPGIAPGSCLWWVQVPLLPLCPTLSSLHSPECILLLLAPSYQIAGVWASALTPSAAQAPPTCLPACLGGRGLATCHAEWVSAAVLATNGFKSSQLPPRHEPDPAGQVQTAA